MDVPFESWHEHTLYGSSKNQFDIFQVKLQFENPCHNKQIVEYFENYHVFYEPVGNYIKKRSVGIVGYVFTIKIKYNIIAFYHYVFSVLIFTKHDEEAQLLNKLLDCIH